jgi:cell division protease FtsH
VTAREIECAVRVLLDGAFSRATRILEVNRAALALGARRLLDKETLTEPELLAVVVEATAATPAPPPQAEAGLVAV